MDHAPPAPRPHLALAPAMLVALGMIMSTDVLKTAPTVAQNVAPGLFVWLWIGGGLVSLVGALCYVEMACAFPDAGGEYSFLSRAWGPRVGALYAWSRFAVLHTGWIALMAHLLADYASALVPMDAAMRTVFALMVVALLALINCAHVRIGFLTQALMVALVALGFAAVIAAGFVAAPAHAQTLAIPAGDRQIGGDRGGVCRAARDGRPARPARRTTAPGCRADLCLSRVWRMERYCHAVGRASGRAARHGDRHRGGDRVVDGAVHRA